MRRGRPPHPDVLTPRQWEVLELVREGRSNGEIGRALGISRDGAKFHVSEILTKLGVTSRDEAAEWRGEPAPARTAGSLQAQAPVLATFAGRDPGARRATTPARRYARIARTAPRAVAGTPDWRQRAA
ncbi:MAG: response regulator transcription factor [Dehalococcoidia bacterium]|nr:response regulator transcription factor [Dehalococcoidia bacterium]